MIYMVIVFTMTWIEFIYIYLGLPSKQLDNMFRQHRRLIFLIFSFLICQFGRAQQTVTGRLTTKDGSTVPDCNVIVKGTSIGTTTDFDGYFELSVPSPEDTLVFSSLGLQTKEVALEGRTSMEVTVKYQCYVHFWDFKDVSLYAIAGVIRPTYGGKLNIALPKVLFFVSEGTLFGDLTYQVNSDNDDFLRAGLEYRHFIYDCDYSLDFNVRYRAVDISQFSSWVYAVEADFNYKKHTIIVGYSGLRQDILTAGFEEFRNYAAPLIGLGTSFSKQRWTTSIMGKIALYGSQKEIESELKFDYKRLSLFLNYYRFDTFSELSAGVGMNLSYALKRKRT